MIITYGGKDYDIQNWEEFRNQVYFLLGEGLTQAFQEEAMRMGLVRTGRYVRGFNHYIKDGELQIDNDAEYAAYLEFGTMEYFDIYGLDSFPQSTIKKFTLNSEQRKKLPSGMNPFAPMRRVLYSQSKVDDIIKRWF